MICCFQHEAINTFFFWFCTTSGKVVNSVRLTFAVRIHLSIVITLPVSVLRCSWRLSRSKVVSQCATVTPVWNSTLGLWARFGKLHGDVWEKHWSIESVCQGPLFTGKAKCWGQTPGEMFLLDRSGEILLQSPSVAPSPHYTKPLQTWRMLWSECLKGIFPVQARLLSLFILHSFHQSVWVTSSQKVLPRLTVSPTLVFF